MVVNCDFLMVKKNKPRFDSTNLWLAALREVDAPTACALGKVRSARSGGSPMAMVKSSGSQIQEPEFQVLHGIHTARVEVFFHTTSQKHLYVRGKT
jgi:hypothetical protein